MDETQSVYVQPSSEGALYHGQAVSTILDEFKTNTHSGITISHLLTHTSGLVADPNFFLEPHPHRWWDSFHGKSKGTNWIEAALEGPLQRSIDSAVRFA